MTQRRSITSQAARRLVLSLGLLAAVVALSALFTYRITMDKASAERADALRDFYQARLMQLDREWEIQAREFRVRVEYTRLLESPHSAALNLQAFMTIQGGDRRFRYLLIRDRDGRPAYHFGREITLEALSAYTPGEEFFFDSHQGRFYRVFEDPIWLGSAGMGKLALFFPIDHALLGQLAAPGVELEVIYHGTEVASSFGARGLGGAEDTLNAQQRTIPWFGDEEGPVRLSVRAPVKALFTSTELTLAAGLIPLVDGLILWFTLGTWLMRQTRRINALDQAVHSSADHVLGKGDMERKLREASTGQQDEIDAFADTIRRTVNQREQAEQRIIALNRDLQAQNRQLEAMNSELESFIYSVSHDLRAPLRHVSGYSTILMEDYKDQLDATAVDYLMRLDASAARMNQRIDDLLYLSRISRQEIALETVDLSALVATQVAELRETHPAREVEVVIESSVTARADPRLVGVALANLLANVWKFTQHTPAARIEFFAVERSGKTVYQLRDNGAGFDPTLAERLFKPFHRLHSEAEFEGTGLGLAIVERIIRRHGGRVWAAGTPGQGATISFTLR